MYVKVQFWDHFYLTSIYVTFFEVRDVEHASFPDDITPYTCLPEMISILEKLEKGIQSILAWFLELFKSQG